MPPSIHPVDLIVALRHKHLTPAIVFLTSRRACDEAMQAFDHSRIAAAPGSPTGYRLCAGTRSSPNIPASPSIR